MSVIAFTYDAAVHCIWCARDRFGDDGLADRETVDSEGNEIGAISQWDETCADYSAADGGGDFSCDDCGHVIREWAHKPDDPWQGPLCADMAWFVAGYCEALVWQATDGEGGTFDNYDLSYAAQDRCIAECIDWARGYVWQMLRLADYRTCIRDGKPGADMTHLGHDYCLSSLGHGTGFWDRGMGRLGDRLHASAGYSSIHVYLGDDGELEIM